MLFHLCKIMFLSSLFLFTLKEPGLQSSNLQHVNTDDALVSILEGWRYRSSHLRFSITYYQRPYSLSFNITVNVEDKINLFLFSSFFLFMFSKYTFLIFFKNKAFNHLFHSQVLISVCYKCLLWTYQTRIYNLKIQCKTYKKTHPNFSSK